MAINVVNANKNDTYETALTLFKGEVLDAFNQVNIARDLIQNKTIEGGKSEQFIVVGRGKTSDVTTKVRGQDVPTTFLENDEVTITLGAGLEIAKFLDSEDGKIAQYDIASRIAKANGQAMADLLDTQIFKLIGNDVLNATPKVDQLPAKVIVMTGYDAAADGKDKGNIAIKALFKAKAEYKKRFINETPVAVTDIDTYNNIAQSDAINSDYTTQNGGLDTGTVNMVAGFSFKITTNLDTTTNPNLKVLIFTENVAGILTLTDLKSTTYYDELKAGMYYITRYRHGMGVLDPTSLIVINDDAV